MKKLLLTMMFLPVLSLPSNAQEQKTFKLTVTSEDLQIIGTALDDLPFKKAAPLIQKLNQQIQMQTTPPAKPDTSVPIPTPKPAE